MQTVTCSLAVLVESVAKTIYDQWSGVEGWVPWVPAGNSFKQDEARKLARDAIQISVVEKEDE